MKKGSLITIEIVGIRHDGVGYALVEGNEIRIRNVLPGDICKVCIDRFKPDHIMASLVELTERKIPATDPECPHFTICGGCLWRHVPYKEQCKIKSMIAAGAIEKSKYCYTNHIELVPSPETKSYRNKMEFTFDSPPYLDGQKMIGLHARGRYNRIFDLEKCLLQSENLNEIIALTRDFSIEKGLSIWGMRSHKGLLRYLTLREGMNTGEYMVNLVTSGEEFKDENNYGRFLLESTDLPLTIIRSINRRPAGVAIGEEKKTLEGKGYITDRIGGYIFQISPDSFFQTNTSQAFNLYETTREFAALTGKEKVLDLYCGTGTIGIYLSGDSAEVTGIENVSEAVSDARMNASLNDADNVTFINAAVEDLATDSFKCDLAVCDPPRSGIHPKGLSNILDAGIPRIIYVSCNAGAMTKDLDTFHSAGYRLSNVRALDMAPHTPHVETVVLLEK